MLTFRLADSLPRSARSTLLDTMPQDARRERIEEFLDAGYGSCVLRRRDIAAVVEDELLHFDGERYRMLAWVIMPNHVHVLIEPLPGHALSAILHSWKSYSAKAANTLIGRTGAFWQPEYFDRAIRGERHLNDAIEYIEWNPVKAGLVDLPGDWLFSSYRERSDGRTGGRVARAPWRREPTHYAATARSQSMR